MRKIKFEFCGILALSILAALSSCDQSSRGKQSLNNCDSLIRGRKTLSVELPMYAVDGRFNQILDSVLMVEKSCNYYKECLTGFAFRITAVDSSRVVISAVNILKYDYQKCYGVFEYNGFRFICSEGHNLSFLKRSDRDVRIDYLDFDRDNDWFLYSDEYSAWDLVASGPKISVEGHYPCPVDSSRIDTK